LTTVSLFKFLLAQQLYHYPDFILSTSSSPKVIPMYLSRREAEALPWLLMV